MGFLLLEHTFINVMTQKWKNGFSFMRDRCLRLVNRITAGSGSIWKKNL